jgi:hypothetical protein
MSGGGVENGWSLRFVVKRGGHVLILLQKIHPFLQ